jgi:hypothetical protein
MPTIQDILDHIYTQYHQHIIKAASLHNLRPEVIAAIICRESEGGLSHLLDVQGPEGRGDNGHGHGLMQIDDRWHPTYIRSGMWRDPYDNIRYGCVVLRQSINGFARIDKYKDDAEKYGIAGYNAGPSRVVMALDKGADCDSVTSHGDYSKTILMNAKMYEDVYINGFDNS